MKKVITILILSLLFFSQIGYRFIYLVQQHQLKEAAEEQLLATLHNDQLDIIDATANDRNIRWEEEGKEFYLNGQLYDVARIETINGKKILYCLNDKKEERLLDDLAKTIKSSTDNNTGDQGNKHTLKLQLSDFTITTIKETIESIDLISFQYPRFTTAIHSVIQEVNTPPPNKNLYYQTLIL